MLDPDLTPPEAGMSPSGWQMLSRYCFMLTPLARNSSSGQALDASPEPGPRGSFLVSYPRARSYVAINTPVRVVLLSTSRSDACVPPANSRRPVPSTKGAIISRYSSIKSAAISEPISRVEFGQSSLAAGLLEATYLRAVLSASLNGPPRAFQEASSSS